MARDDMLITFTKFEENGSTTTNIYHTWGGVNYESGVEVSNKTGSGRPGAGIGFIGARTAATLSGQIEVADDLFLPPIKTSTPAVLPTDVNFTGTIIESIEQNQGGRSKEAQALSLKEMEGSVIKVVHRSIVDRPVLVGTMESVKVIDEGKTENSMMVSFQVRELLGISPETGQPTTLEKGEMFVPLQRIFFDGQEDTDEQGGEPGSGEKKCIPFVGGAKHVANWVEDKGPKALRWVGNATGITEAYHSVAGAVGRAADAVEEAGRTVKREVIDPYVLGPATIAAVGLKAIGNELDGLGDDVKWYFTPTAGGCNP